MKKGVSIVICCYNSSKLLPDTLMHIFNLKVPSGIPYEIIIVDNNSKDNTSGIAREQFLKYNCTAPYKILFQENQGLSYARKMGFENSEYEYIIYCDDDNRLSEDYLSISFKIMSENEKIGALGGDSIEISDVKFPDWFSEFRQSYSVGSQSEKAGDITWQRGALWGAGMVLRKSALNELYCGGYKSLLTDRKKSELTSGGDVELCYALRLAGWKIWYEPSLKIRHFIPEQRLSWEYLRKLSRGFGAQKIYFDPYLKAFEPSAKNFKYSIKQKWQYQAIALIRKLRFYGLRKLLKFRDSYEGDPEILRIEKTIGRLNEIIKIRSEYASRIQEVKNAAWRKVFTKEINK